MPDDKTLVVDSPPLEPPRERTCPNCGAVHTELELARADYRCSCGLELAYLETTPTGATRSVLGWLHRPGEVILERYRVEKVLGKGGFAATYLVQDLRLNGRKRAIKEIPELLYDETETEMLSHLSHPSVPDIIDRERVGNMVCLVLELGGGRTLESERRSRGGRIPVETLMPWMQQLGEVIMYLHSQDPPIIHRDLKPDNVLLDDRDRIMLIDFGIAKQSADSGGTRTIARAATQGYSPPEQALGTGTDPRSDVYALAATAYSLLTGQVPPPAHERVAGAELIPPQQLVPELPASIGDTLVEALNLNINRRPATVEQLLQPLGAVVPPATTGFTPTTSQTLRVGELPPEYTEKEASIRIHSERVTVAPTAAQPKKSRSGLWVVAGLVLAAAAGGVWMFQEPIREQLFPQEEKTADSTEAAPTKPEDAEPATLSTTPAATSTHTPSAAATAPVASAPVEPSVQAQVETPAVDSAATSTAPTPTPAATGGSVTPVPTAPPPAAVAGADQAPAATAPSAQVPAPPVAEESATATPAIPPPAVVAGAVQAPAAAAPATQTPTPAIAEDSATATPATLPAAAVAGATQTPAAKAPAMPPRTFPPPPAVVEPKAPGSSAMSAFESRRSAMLEDSKSHGGAEATVVKTPQASPGSRRSVEATVAKKTPAPAAKKKTSSRPKRTTSKKTVKKTTKKPKSSGWSASYIGSKAKD